MSFARNRTEESVVLEFFCDRHRFVARAYWQGAFFRVVVTKEQIQGIAVRFGSKRELCRASGKYGIAWKEYVEAGTTGKATAGKLRRGLCFLGGEVSVQAAMLRGERLLVGRGRAAHGVRCAGTLEEEGASVLLARTLPQALQYASYPALSAGIIDLRVGADDAEPRFAMCLAGVT